jgi:tetratricopeptide (TPR) repeat protein
VRAVPRDATPAGPRKPAWGRGPSLSAPERLTWFPDHLSHNYHFEIYAAVFLGQCEVALETAAQLEASIPQDLLRVPSPPMADWLEAFLAMRVHVLIRFGRWADILELPLPADPELYRVTTAMLHYARGVALSATDRITDAEAERRLFREAVAQVPETRMLFSNTCADILAIASAMLDGELEYRKGRYDAAFAALERSIELDDNLPYDEPWGWMQPTRHAYGALLLEQGGVAEAEAVYRADLGLDGTLPRALQHPGNVWSLHGLHECLVRLGRTGEAQIVAQQPRRHRTGRRTDRGVVLLPPRHRPRWTSLPRGLTWRPADHRVPAVSPGAR